MEASEEKQTEMPADQPQIQETEIIVTDEKGETELVTQVWILHKLIAHTYLSVLQSFFYFETAE